MGLFRWTCIGCDKEITLDEFDNLDDCRIDPAICYECFNHPLGKKLLEEREKRVDTQYEFEKMKRFWTQAVRGQYFDEMLERLGYDKGRTGGKFVSTADLVSYDYVTCGVVFETGLYLQGRVHINALKYTCQKHHQMMGWELPEYLIGDFGCETCLGRREDDCQCKYE